MVRRPDATARILESTERLLRNGVRFSELPVERLLTEANVSRSTFYAHFTDKSALLVTLASRTIADVTASGASWWGASRRLTREDAVATVLGLIRLYREHVALIRAIVEVAAYDDEVRGWWHEVRAAFASPVADRLRLEQAAGHVPPDLDVDGTVAHVTLLVHAAVLDHIRHGSARYDHEVAEAVARIRWLAYGAPRGS